MKFKTQDYMKTVKRFLTFFLITCFSVQVWGADYDFSSSIPTPWTASPSPFSYETNNTQRGAQWTSNFTLKLNNQTNVTEVKVTYSTNKANNKMAVSVGSTAFGSQKTLTNGASKTELSFTGSATSGNISISITRSNGSIWIKKIEVISSGGGGGGGDTYKIIYDKNHPDASGSMSPTDADSENKATVAENAFSAPDGMAFASWNTKADGSGDVYNKEDVITLTSDTTLYAQWEKSDVEIVEWFPDSIRIVVPNATDASVIIENKDNISTETTNLATDVFFSKYFEAAGYTKLVGLYNGTDHAIDISDLRLRGGTNSWSSSKGNHNFIQISDIQKLCNEYGDGTKGHPIMLPAGTEIILYSIVEQNKSSFTGPNCMDKYVNWDDLANNVKPNWYRIGTYPTGTATEGSDTDGHNTLNFSGPYSVSLERKTSGAYKLIDIIGAGNITKPVDTAAKTIPGPKTLGNGVTINTPNDKEGFYTLDGMSPSSEEYPNGYSTYLSTNLCLLIRKNHVTCGDSAVLNNETDFKTIGPYTGVDSKQHQGEWLGVPIGKVDDRNCKSGQQFGYVGTFNYNDFFAQYEAITEKIQLDGQARDDGTYNIPIPNLDDLACTMLKIKVYEGTSTDAKTAREYKVPIMVQENSTQTTDAIFSNIKDGDLAESREICKKCDVVILKGATLTRAAEGSTKDVTEIRDLMIYPGGKLVLGNNSEDYKVNSIQFRVEGDSTPPSAWLEGNLLTDNSKLLVSRRINNSRYYFFSLPYDCNVADIRWSDGETPVLGTDYLIKEYDGATRANTGNLASWKTVSETGTLKAGVGYNIAVSSQYLKELVFPMDLSGKNLSAAEKDKNSGNPTVTVHKYENSAHTIENWNWNLIAHPYVSKFGSYTGDYIKAGYLEWDGYDHWDRKETDKVYVTVLKDYKQQTRIKAGDYDQKLASDLTTMEPFIAVFVQAAGDGDVTFAQGSRKNSAPARHLAAKSEYEDESIFVGVTLSGNNKSDQTNLRIRPDFTEEYQLGYDLVKYGTKSDNRPIIYMARNANNLAFQAVSDENAAKSLPMGVYVRHAGTYTFALSEDYPIDYIEAVYLYDAESGLTTNLLNDSYSFTANTETETKSRFFLSAIVRRPIQSTATGCELIDIDSPMTRKVLIDGHVYIQRDGKVFDITGKQMLNH